MDPLKNNHKAAMRLPEKENNNLKDLFFQGCSNSCLPFPSSCLRRLKTSFLL